jgi:hypothetical protein
MLLSNEFISSVLLGEQRAIYEISFQSASKQGNPQIWCEVKDAQIVLDFILWQASISWQDIGWQKATILLVTYVRVRMKCEWFHLNDKRNEWNYNDFTFPFRDERVFPSNTTLWRYFVTTYYRRSDIDRYIDTYHWYDALITLLISGVDVVIDMIYLYFNSNNSW